MTRIEDDCVGCPIHCVDCGRKRTPHHYCDKCGDETKLYYFDDEELCADCLLDEFDVVDCSE